MNAFRFFLTSVLFLLVTAWSYSQEYTLTGCVIDKSTSNPIPNASIFVTGTTIGCITNSSGEFTIKLPYTPCTLIVDHVSYKAYVNTVISDDDILVELQALVYRIGEISVSGKGKRKKNLRFFYAHFVKKNQSEIKLLNDSVLVFERDEMSFKAKCSEPLIIENENLGYRITTIIEEFKVTVHDGPDGVQLPLNTMTGIELINLDGYFYYESLDNLTKKQGDKFKENRRKAYYGSYRHFLKSLYDRDLSNQGFVIESIPNDSTAFYKSESDNILFGDIEYTIKADSLKVYYYCDGEKQPAPEKEMTARNYVYQQSSTIYPSKETFIVRKNGTSPRLSFIISGEMMVKSFANSLPMDYSPE